MISLNGNPGISSFTVSIRPFWDATKMALQPSPVALFTPALFCAERVMSVPVLYFCSKIERWQLFVRHCTLPGFLSVLSQRSEVFQNHLEWHWTPKVWKESRTIAKPQVGYVKTARQRSTLLLYYRVNTTSFWRNTIINNRPVAISSLFLRKWFQFWLIR